MSLTRRFFAILKQRHKNVGVLNAPYEAGQVWAYKNRPGEEASRLIICKVATDAKLGEIVHLYLNKLAVKNPAAPEGVTPVISHMPYGGAALRPCLTALEGMIATLPAFKDGYTQWKAGFDRGEAGVWTIPLDEAITAMEAALSQAKPPVESTPDSPEQTSENVNP